MHCLEKAKHKISISSEICAEIGSLSSLSAKLASEGCLQLLTKP
jgi:hypothetical protein